MAGKITNKLQVLLFPLHYLSEENWNYMQTPGMNMQVRAAKIVDRLWSFGLRSPAEVTTKAIVAASAVVAAHAPIECSAPNMHATSVAVKSYFLSKRNNNHDIESGYIINFPEKAEQDMLMHTGGADVDPPMNKNHPAFDLMVRTVPMRKSHKTLQAPQMQAQPMVAQPSMQQIAGMLGAQPAMMQQAWGPLLMHMLQQVQPAAVPKQGAPQRAGDIPLTFLGGHAGSQPQAMSSAFFFHLMMHQMQLQLLRPRYIMHKHRLSYLSGTWIIGVVSIAL